MKLYTYFLLFFLSFALFTCITPFQVDVPDAVGGIVITASLTSQPGLQEVRLNRPAAYTNDGFNFSIPNAQVWITDNLGRRVDYENDPSNLGWYLPIDRSFAAEVGKTYVLHIVTPDNLTYESAPETLRAVSPIKKVYAEETIVDDARLGQALSGYSILLDADDPASKGDYYRWSWRHFESLAYCDQLH